MAVAAEMARNSYNTLRFVARLRGCSEKPCQLNNKSSTGAMKPEEKECSNMGNNKKQLDGVSRRRILKMGAVAAGSLSMAGVASANRPTTDTEDIFGQGLDGDVVAEDSARLRRNNSGINTKIQMPTPEPGSYEYPDEGMEEGSPEAFTLWVFVFDNPGDDDWTGAFLGGGHGVSGPQLTLSGRVTKNTEPFAGDSLENPRTADVHFAVAPHGKIDPDELPDQLKTSPGCPDCWWYALFE